MVDECCRKHKINTNTMTTKMTMTNTIQYNDKHKLVSGALLALNVMFVCGDSITVNGMWNRDKSQEVPYEWDTIPRTETIVMCQFHLQVSIPLNSIHWNVRSRTDPPSIRSAGQIQEQERAQVLIRIYHQVGPGLIAKWSNQEQCFLYSVSSYPLSIVWDKH